MQERDRFATLDGFRGLAAILVFLFHAENNAPLRAEGGYLGVDLFFALSGFVLAHAYQERLRCGLSPGRFMAMRFARVYPMYFVMAVIFWSGFHQLLMIPNLTPDQSMYAPNVPMWSLTFELLASLLFALLIVRIGWGGIGCILTTSGILLGWSTLAWNGSIDHGSIITNAPWELVRTIFSFTMGVALFRLRRQRALPSRECRYGWLLLGLFPLPFLFDPANRAWWDLMCIFAIFPALIWFGASWDLPRSRIVRFLGDISYPFYCIHFPLLIFGFESGINLTLLLFLLIGAAWVLDRWYDRPARQWLAALVKRTKFGPQPALNA